MLDADNGHQREVDQRRFYENELAEMQARIAKLEAKNKEYLELFCGTQSSASTNEQTMPQLLDALRSTDHCETSNEALALLEESLNDLQAKASQIEYLKSEVMRW